MEWKNLGQHLAQVADKSEKAALLLKEQSGILFQRASEFTQEKFQNAEFTIKTAEEKTAFLQEPRGVLFCVKKEDNDSLELLAKIPVLLTQNMKEPHCFRVVYEQHMPLFPEISVEKYPNVIFYKAGEKTHQLTPDIHLKQLLSHLTNPS